LQQAQRAALQVQECHGGLTGKALSDRTNDIIFVLRRD
jgi:hypothetical protein